MKTFFRLLLMIALATPAFAQQRVSIIGATLPMTDTITFNGDVMTLTIPPGQGFASIGVDASGTWVGTIAVQCAARTSTSDLQALILAPRNSTTTVTSFTSNGQWFGSIAGCQRIVATATAWTSGTATVTLVATAVGGAGGAGGGGSGSNAAAAATGAAVPADAGYTGIDVSGTLRGWTGLSLGSHFAGTVAVVDGSGNQITSFGGGTQYTQDSALTVASTVGTMAMGRASAAVPTDVSADNDAVLPWYLRSGAQAIQPTFGGVLATAGNGASGTGVQRVTIANDSTGILAAVTSITNTVNTIGTIANDAGAAGTNRIPTLPGITENSAPTRTDGRNAALSLTTGGAARVMVTNAAGAAQTLATDCMHDSAACSTGPQAMGVAAAFGTLPSAVTAADAVRMAHDLQGVVYTRSSSNPCDGVGWTTLAISAAADAVLVAASASNRTYICDGAIIANAAEIFAIWEGTGSTCGTSTAALVGSTTIGNGVPLAANGGFPLKNIRTAGTNVDLCLHLNTTNRVTGYISYVQAP